MFNNFINFLSRSTIVLCCNRPCHGFRPQFGRNKKGKMADINSMCPEIQSHITLTKVWFWENCEWETSNFWQKNLMSKCMAYTRTRKRPVVVWILCNISNTGDSVSSHFRTLWRELKIRRAAEYFWRNTMCLEMWWNIVSCLIYLFNRN